MTDPDRRQRLLELVRACVFQGTVTLASGKTSDFYVDGRLVTLTGEGSCLLGEVILERARAQGATAIAGPTTGACPLVTAAGVLAHQAGESFKLSYVRSAPKGHGLQKAVEGPPLGPEDKVLMVEDVVTSGGSVLRAVERLQEDTGAKVLAVLCVVDREAGGAEAFARAQVPLEALFTKAEVRGE
jgi:orotate phosphoribosyltransferase